MILLFWKSLLIWWNLRKSWFNPSFCRKWPLARDRLVWEMKNDYWADCYWVKLVSSRFFSVNRDSTKINVWRQAITKSAKINNVKLFLKYHWPGNTTIYAFIAESYVYLTEKILFRSAFCSAQAAIEQTSNSVIFLVKTKVLETHENWTLIQHIWKIIVICANLSNPTLSSQNEFWSKAILFLLQTDIRAIRSTG